MAFDEGLAQRIREHLGGTPGLSERQMFGGIGFLLDGHLCVGVIGDDLIARVGPDAYDAALARDGARPFDFTGRAMTGWVTVGPDPIEDDEALVAWIDECRTFVATLPAK